MKILFICVTQQELDWATKKAEKSKHKNEEWWVIKIKPHLFDMSSLPETATNFHFLNLTNLGIDNQEVWQKCKRLQDELHEHLAENLWREIDIIIKENLDIFLFDYIFTETIAEKAIEKVKPDVVYISPASVSSVDKSFQRVFGTLQWTKHFKGIIEVAARNQGINCCLPLSNIFKAKINLIKLTLIKYIGVASTITYDLIRVLRWIFFKTRGEDLPIFQSDSIIITNHDSDLHRQFDITKLPETLKRKIVLWLGVSGRELLTVPEWRQRAYLPETSKEELKLNKNTYIDLRRISDSVFPTLAFPSLLKYSGKWYCKIIPSAKPSKVSDELWNAFNNFGTASERLANWNRIADAVKRIAFVQDLFKRIKPALLIASDTEGSNKFIAIAGLSSGIKVMSTSHAIDVSNDYISKPFLFGTVSCSFAQFAPHLADLKFPGPKSQRLIAYDTNVLTGVNLSNQKENTQPTVLLVTSVYNFCTSTLGTNLFIDTEKYAASLENIVKRISGLNPSVKIVIKSHPLDDAYELYEFLKNKYPETIIKHWKEPFTPDTMMPARVVLFYNCLSTMFFQLATRDIAIIGHYGALTDTGRMLLALPDLLGSDDDEKVVEYTQDIFNNPDEKTHEAARLMAKKVFDKFIEPPVGGFESAISISREVPSVILA